MNVTRNRISFSKNLARVERAINFFDFRGIVCKFVFFIRSARGDDDTADMGIKNAVEI